MKRTKLNKYSKREIPKLKRKLQPIFNRFIVDRDAHCIFPGCGKTNKDYRLECSHFFSQGAYQGVRFDEDNCDALCHAHHAGNITIGWEYQKNGAYREWKMAQLGVERFAALEKRAREGHQWTAQELQSLIEKYGES